MTVLNNPEPRTKRSRWVSALAVCAGTVGLAALLGAAMVPSAPSATPVAAATVLQPTEQENYVARRVSDVSRWRASTMAGLPSTTISRA